MTTSRDTRPSKAQRQEHADKLGLEIRRVADVRPRRETMRWPVEKRSLEYQCRCGRTPAGFLHGAPIAKRLRDVAKMDVWSSLAAADLLDPALVPI